MPVVESAGSSASAGCVEAAIESALHKLSGNLVATPLIGALRLPETVCPQGLRIKPESLQVGGGIWFRGAMHELGRHLGALKGVVAGGAPRVAYCTAVAAAAHRFPTVVVLDRSSLDPELGTLFDTLDCEVVSVNGEADVEATVTRTAAERGFYVMPGLEAEAYAVGIATVGLELARELPFDTATVFVAPAKLAAPIELGLRAGGRGCAVRGVDPRVHGDRARLARELRIGARLDCDADGAAALSAGFAQSAGSSPCVVLSS